MKADFRKDVITGQETEEGLNTPLQALVTSYKAFNT